jgi:hypothetical protein
MGDEAAEGNLGPVRVDAIGGSDASGSGAGGSGGAC